MASSDGARLFHPPGAAESVQLERMKGFAMDIEERLRKLELRYRSILSAVVAAKAHFMALDGEPSSTPAGIERAKISWQNLEARKAGIAAQIDALEELEQQATA